MTLPRRPQMPDWIEENDPDLLVFLVGIAQGRLHLAQQAGGNDWFVPERPKAWPLGADYYHLMTGPVGSHWPLGRLTVEREVAQFIGVNSPEEMIRRHQGELEMLQEHQPIFDTLRFPRPGGDENRWLCQSCSSATWPCSEVLRMCKTYGVEMALMS